MAEAGESLLGGLDGTSKNADPFLVSPPCRTLTFFFHHATNSSWSAILLPLSLDHLVQR